MIIHPDVTALVEKSEMAHPFHAGTGRARALDSTNKTNFTTHQKDRRLNLVGPAL